jgi:type I restriction enzyme S subunit
MSENLIPYSKYIDSNISWIDDIPESWSIVRNRVFLKEINIPSILGDEELLTVSQYTGITKRRDRLTDETDLLTTAKTLEGYKIVEKEAMVMNIMLAWNGSLGISDFDGIVSPAYCVFRINKNYIFPKYLHYLHRTRLYTGVFETASTGVIKSRLRLYPEKYLALKSALPPVQEQIQIARFLDWKTTQIAKFIKAKKRMIEFLKEQKQVIINNAVTGKIDFRNNEPYPKYKDSRVEWLGEIPEHWEIIKLKHLCSLIKDGTHLPPQRVDDGIPLLSVRNLVNGRYIKFRKDDSKISYQDYIQLEKAFSVEENDILLAIVGATMGKVSLVPKMSQFTIQRSTAIFRTLGKLMSYKFLFYFFQSTFFQNLLWRNTEFSAQPGIYLGALANFSCPYPPTDKQLEIVKLIEKDLYLVDKNIDNIHSEIELLSEYRTRLIADAVTGKIDVRDVMVPKFKEEDVLPDFEVTSDVEEVLDDTTVDNDL